jgi:hypothetical protein
LLVIVVRTLAIVGRRSLIVSGRWSLIVARRGTLIATLQRSPVISRWRTALTVARGRTLILVVRSAIRTLIVRWPGILGSRRYRRPWAVARTDIGIVARRVIAIIPRRYVAAFVVSRLVVIRLGNVGGIRIDWCVVPPPTATGEPPPTPTTVPEAVMPPAMRPRETLRRREMREVSMLERKACVTPPLNMNRSPPEWL